MLLSELYIYNVESVFTLKNISQVAAEIIKLAGGPKCFAFYAPMGAGKTTLINELCKQLEVLDATSSPTYSIINEYETAKGDKVVHMDWYRLNDENDVLNAGVGDYLHDNIFCFVEWPERAKNLLPPGALHIHLEVLDTETRRLIIENI